MMDEGAEEDRIVHISVGNWQFFAGETAVLRVGDIFPLALGLTLRSRPVPVESSVPEFSHLGGGRYRATSSYMERSGRYILTSFFNALGPPIGPKMPTLLPKTMYQADMDFNIQTAYLYGPPIDCLYRWRVEFIFEKSGPTAGSTPSAVSAEGARAYLIGLQLVEGPIG